MAFQYGLPLLLIIERGVRQEGIYSFGVAFTILTWNSEAPDPINTFFNNVPWKEILQNGAAEVRSGYSKGRPCGRTLRSKVAKFSYPPDSS
ncbi:MAG: hypothetical protein APF81_20710 [Desulfosporosinus sp. BRH_c37]|nr:MAG: hypothetical protein APF81_20710 [Desulfosporosinus sp. BRH_c37]